MTVQGDQMRGDWDPDQYRRFSAQRERPFWDLAGMVDRSGVQRAVDLGCGDGALTAALADRLGATEMIGVDSSPAMLERTAAHASERVRFVAGDLAEWTSGGDVDLVFANASLHWAPDHRGVLARWTRALAPGGQLAVQMPSNADHLVHATASDVAETEPFAAAFGGPPPVDPVGAHVLTPADYATLLHDLGFAEQEVVLRVYGMELPTVADVVEWVRGSTLTRFFKRLPEDLHEPFVDAYRRELIERIGHDGAYFYPFKRILLHARRP